MFSMVELKILINKLWDLSFLGSKAARSPTTANKQKGQNLNKFVSTTKNYCLYIGRDIFINWVSLFFSQNILGYVEVLGFRFGTFGFLCWFVLEVVGGLIICLWCHFFFGQNLWCHLRLFILTEKKKTAFMTCLACG